MLIVAIGAGRAPAVVSGPHAAVATRTADVADIRAAILAAPLHHEVVLTALAPELAYRTRERVGLIAELASRTVVHWSPRTSVLALYVALRSLPALPPSPSLALASLQARIAATWAVTWFPRVGGLDHPAPSLAQHVRSWLPGAGFLTRFDEDPLKVRRADEELTPFSSVDDVRPAHALSAGPVPSALQERFAELSRCPVYAVGEDLADAHRTLYGIAPVAELVATPAHPGRPGAPRPVRVHGTCSSCGWETATSTCDFCHVRVTTEPADRPTGRGTTSSRAATSGRTTASGRTITSGRTTTSGRTAATVPQGARS